MYNLLLKKDEIHLHVQSDPYVLMVNLQCPKSLWESSVTLSSINSVLQVAYG